MSAGMNVQLINPPAANIFPRVELAMQSERLITYMAAAGKDKNSAFALYLWNCTLCEAFFVSLHFAEIVCRNAIHNRLLTRYGSTWFENATFLNVMDSRFREELTNAVSEERLAHPADMTAHHVDSALTFAFWQHLTTKRFERMLWAADGIRASFPNIPNRIGRQELYERIESVRRWRNRIAHHQAIFDKGPMSKHQDTLGLIRWVCSDTGDWISSVSRVPAAISARPAQISN
jgi:hypothetical protein